MNLAGFFGSGLGLFIIVFLVVTAVLYFFIPWMIRAINNKMTELISNIKLVIQLLREIKEQLKKNNPKTKEL